MTDTDYTGPADFWDEYDRETAVRNVVPAPVATFDAARIDRRRRLAKMHAMTIGAGLFICGFVLFVVA